MNRALVLVCITCVFIEVIARTTKKPMKNMPKSYFITNWSQYQMSEEIDTIKLKTILEQIAEFKRLEYCPFTSSHRCRSASVKDVVKQIIRNVLKQQLQAPDPKVIQNPSNEKKNNGTTVSPGTNTGKADKNTTEDVTERSTAINNSSTANQSATDLQSKNNSESTTESTSTTTEIANNQSAISALRFYEEEHESSKTNNNIRVNFIKLIKLRNWEDIKNNNGKGIGTIFKQILSLKSGLVIALRIIVL